MQNGTATVTKALEPFSGSDAEDHSEEGNVMKTGSRPLYSLREALKRGKSVDPGSSYNDNPCLLFEAQLFYETNQ